MKGESLCDDSIWITKTHHPIQFWQQVEYSTNKTIFVVRNPIDVLPSYVAFICTANHGTKPEFNSSRDYPEYWDWFIRTFVGQMKRFFDTIRKEF